MIFSALVFLSFLACISSTALDDYVWRFDENYKWEHLTDKTISAKYGSKGYTGYTLNMTSQKWLTDEDFAPNSDAKSIWHHYLVVIVPDEVLWTNNATLYITGGGVNDGPPQPSDEDIQLAAALAITSSIITGVLFGIPNEHTIFASDPLQKSRTEDAVIAFTWDHFLKDPSQPEWLLRFPMVKASLRAMDAITEFVAKELPDLNCQLDYYTVAGASKRGWTTWDVGAVDQKRVQAIVPIVLDAINFVSVMHHQFRSYGAWSFALQDYADMDIMSRIDHPNMIHLQENVDPHFYRERLTMPKLVVNAVLDEFQQPDDTRYWWDAMPEPKHFLMTPNAEHSFITGIFEAVPAIGAWLQNILNKEATPTMTWKISESTGEIVAAIGNHGVVHEVNLWQAHSCGTNADGIKRRDFRVAMVGPVQGDKTYGQCECGVGTDGYCGNLKSFWTKTTINGTVERGIRTYRAQVEAQPDGRYTAFLLEARFAKNPREQKLEALPFPVPVPVPPRPIPDRPGYVPPIAKDLRGNFMCTTEVSVWPNTFPYPECTGISCGNTLV